MQSTRLDAHKKKKNIAEGQMDESCITRSCFLELWKNESLTASG